MKIEFEFDCSYRAKLVIDGRELGIELTPGMGSLKGVKSPETSNTLGGMIASELLTKSRDIMQAWAAAQEEAPGAGTWDVLPDRAADAAYEALV